MPFGSCPLPADPWGRPYVYRSSAGEVEIVSLGRDGKTGGQGEDADIKNR